MCRQRRLKQVFHYSLWLGIFTQKWHTAYWYSVSPVWSLSQSPLPQLPSDRNDQDGQETLRPKEFFFCFVSFLSFFGMTKKRRRSPGWGNLDRDDKGNSLVSSHANGHIIQVGRLKKRTGVRTVRIGRPHTIVTIVDFWATRRLLLLPL